MEHDSITSSRLLYLANEFFLNIYSKDLYAQNGGRAAAESYSQQEIVSNYTSRRNSVNSNANSEPQEVAPHLVK